MCLALPAEVLAIKDGTATVAVGGVETAASLLFLEDVSVGDFVVVHVGFALSKIHPELAAEQLALMASLADGGRRGDDVS